MFAPAEALVQLVWSHYGTSDRPDAKALSAGKSRRPLAVGQHARMSHLSEECSTRGYFQGRTVVAPILEIMMPMNIELFD
jgi:hypothetical protein